jgi:hypothetical protein
VVAVNRSTRPRTDNTNSPQALTGVVLDAQRRGKEGYMKTPKDLLVLALAIAALAVSGGCERLWTPQAPDGGVRLLHNSGPGKTVGLFTRDSCELGILTIWNDNGNVYVRFTSSPLSHCYLRRTRLAVGLALKNIPHDGQGRPVPSKFPFKATHHPLRRVSSFTYSIPLTDWEPGTLVYVAGHAELCRGFGGCLCKTWAGCCQFPCPDWACYTTFVIQQPPLQVSGPPGGTD